MIALAIGAAPASATADRADYAAQANTEARLSYTLGATDCIGSIGPGDLLEG